MTEINSRREGTLIANTVTGEVELDTLAEFVERHIGEWADSPVLWDLSGVNLEQVSSAKLQAFTVAMATVADKRAGGRTAIYAPEDLQFGMMRVFEVFAENVAIPIDFCVFKTLEEARSWLAQEAES